MDRSRARSILYGTLASCYSHPNNDIRSWIAEGEWVGLVEEALSELTEASFDDFLLPFSRAIEKEGSCILLVSEYSRLFSNGSLPGTTPSGKSIHHSDQIVHEFEHMAALTQRESFAKGVERIRLEEEQMKFFSDFILPWVPAFSRKAEGEEVSSFYGCLRKLTLEFIELERNYLGIPDELIFDSQEEKNNAKTFP
jgi:hypothetical protein